MKTNQKRMHWGGIVNYSAIRTGSYRDRIKSLYMLFPSSDEHIHVVEPDQLARLIGMGPNAGKRASVCRSQMVTKGELIKHSKKTRTGTTGWIYGYSVPQEPLPDSVIWELSDIFHVRVGRPDMVCQDHIRSGDLERIPDIYMTPWMDRSGLCAFRHHDTWDFWTHKLGRAIHEKCRQFEEAVPDYNQRIQLAVVALSNGLMKRNLDEIDDIVAYTLSLVRYIGTEEFIPSEEQVEQLRSNGAEKLVDIIHATNRASVIPDDTYPDEVYPSSNDGSDLDGFDFLD